MPLFIDVFYYFLLLWLHPSIISSSVTLTAELLLLLISPRTLLPPLLSVCLQCLKDGVSGSWPLIPAGLQLTCMTAQLHAQYAGNWKWLALYIWKGSPTDTRPITIYQKHIEAKTLSTCVKLTKCGHYYRRKWRLPVLPTPSSFPWPFYIFTTCSLLISPAVHVLLKTSETWIIDLKAPRDTLQPILSDCQVNCQSFSQKQRWRTVWGSYFIEMMAFSRHYNEQWHSKAVNTKLLMSLSVKKMEKNVLHHPTDHNKPKMTIMTPDYMAHLTTFSNF